MKAQWVQNRGKRDIDGDGQLILTEPEQDRLKERVCIMVADGINEAFAKEYALMTIERERGQ
jgi:hypothetical protein